jgi:hypothetical protein
VALQIIGRSPRDVLVLESHRPIPLGSF